MTDYEKLFRLDGRRAVVVGAGSGIGRECARGLAAAGAEVVCADRDLAAAQATADGLGGGGGVAFAVDVTSADDCARAVAELEPADVLVVTPGFNVRKRLLDTSDEDFQRVFEVNLLGTYRLIRDFGRGMAGRGRGSIIVFSSFRAQVIETGQGLYGACKAGVVQLAKTLAEELGESGVRVNAVAPGPVDTPLTAQIKNDPEWWDAYADKTVLKRWATPDEMVGGVVYLASDASSYTSGSLLMMDGGWTAADGRFRPRV